MKEDDENVSKFVTNPSGPYKLDLLYKGIKYKIMIKNLSEYEFDIFVRSNKKITKNEIESLKRYLEEEGFNNEATKHNLFW